MLQYVMTGGDHSIAPHLDLATVSLHFLQHRLP